MKHSWTSVLLCGLLVAGLVPSLAAASAADTSQSASTASAEKGDKGVQAEKEKEPREETSVTHHSVTVDGQKLNYTATAGTLLLKKENDEARAQIFYIAYTLDGVKDATHRPITFSFNGGPGSSSVWLHLGLLGPRRVDEPDGPTPPRPPYHLVDNQETLLGSTDLVFIDPVTTGYSRAVPENAKPAEFHGVKGDIESVGDFIRLYLTRAERWASPKFLIGESYGTTRAAGLSGYLEQRHGVYLNGIMLISSVLDFQTIDFGNGNELPYVLFLPGYTATAWYHHRLPEDLQADRAKALKESEAFAAGEYRQALFAGRALAPEERSKVARELARLTGLSEDYVERSDLRVSAQRYFKELLRDEGKTVGRLDSRFVGRDTDSAGATAEYDPLLAAVMGAYTATLNDYVRRDLGFKSDLPYEILTGRVWPWNFSEYENRYVNVAPTLRDAMVHNPYLKVFVAGGYYDLGTPFYATIYTFNHLRLPEELSGNLSMDFFDAGHMMYIHGPSRARLRDDLQTFIADAAGTQ
jgi:carboxypeptidase C (cathepsin A)